MRPWAGWVVAALFTISGVVHLVHPATFTGIVPHFLPGPRALVLVSGGAELVCAVGLWRRTRWAGVAAAVLLVVIWPANLQDAVTAQESARVGTQIVEWVRLPLQIPLIWCALQSGRPITSDRGPASRGPDRRPPGPRPD